MNRRLQILTVIGLACAAFGGAPARYRDLKVYTTSAPDPKDASRIVATMRLINAGKSPLNVRMALGAHPAAGFGGTKFDGTIEPSKEAACEFEFTPPDGIKYEILTGTIAFDDPPVVDRELYVAIQGPDPADFDPTKDRRNRVEKITAKAQVVATYAPRTVESIRRTIDASRRNAEKHPSLTLAENGTSNYRIVVAPPSTQPAQPAEGELADAVADLARCVKIQTGADLPIVASLPDAEHAIRLRRIDAPKDWPHPDAYRLHTEGENIFIDAANFEGLCNGVYGLLVDHLDCRWFMPKQLGEEIAITADKSTTLATSIDETKGPSFFSCGGMSWGSAPRWDRQNRCVVNRGRMGFGHAWQGLLSKEKYPYDKFTDMWARDRSGKVMVFDKGWSWTNFCSTNPEVIQIVADSINAQFDANPDAIVMSLDPNDLAPMCQCDRCLAVDRRYGVGPGDDKQMSDRLLHFSREIYDRLKPQHKEKWLGILAYGFQTRPPKTAVPHAHHATMLCDFPSYFDHSRPFDDPTSSFNRDFYDIAKGWSAADVKMLGFYDYYGHYNFFGPWGIIHKMREDLPTFKEMGGTFIMIEAQPNFAMHGLNLYVASRLVWDIDADVDAIVEEYITKFYGPAADAMREFFRDAEKYYALTRPGTHTALRVARRAEFWDLLDTHLKIAEHQTRNLPGVDKRFADRIAFARDGFDFGRAYYEMSSLRRIKKSDDLAAKIDSLRVTKATFDRMQAKYTPADPYWPTMLATYFYPDLAGILKQLEEIRDNPNKLLDENWDPFSG